jgi:pimeloyl-ACP methyl ester carboxylesterase
VGVVNERYVQVDGVRTFLREVEGDGTPTVFVHGNPTNSSDWEPFLERLDGPALAPDLPCFGRSERPPRRRFDPTMDGYADFCAQFLDELEVDRYSLVVHDWGTVGLMAALRRPERIERLVIVNAVPLLPGYRWHWVARIWRRRLLGELVNATSTRRAARLQLRQARAGFRPMPEEFIESFWPHWDAGTRRAVLRLYRSADPDALAAAGADLGRLSCPSLVLWGMKDPYLPARFAHAYAERLPNAELVEVDSAGHWPWIDAPAVINRIVAFLTAG